MNKDPPRQYKTWQNGHSKTFVLTGKPQGEDREAPAANFHTREPEKSCCQLQRFTSLWTSKLLADNIAKPIIELCSLFKQLCSATLMEDDMLKASVKDGVTTKFYIVSKRNVDPPPPTCQFQAFWSLYPEKDMLEEFPAGLGRWTPMSVNACVVDGVRYVVQSRDERRTTQNSGICAPGPDGEMSYGQLQEILEFKIFTNDIAMMKTPLPHDLAILLLKTSSMMNRRVEKVMPNLYYVQWLDVAEQQGGTVVVRILHVHLLHHSIARVLSSTEVRISCSVGKESEKPNLGGVKAAGDREDPEPQLKEAVAANKSRPIEIGSIDTC
ncbi:hypothetical protein Tco_0670509 [Tanacetum coccineum]